MTNLRVLQIVAYEPRELLMLPDCLDQSEQPHKTMQLTDHLAGDSSKSFGAYLLQEMLTIKTYEITQT
jgi:hypothetical protein